MERIYDPCNWQTFLLIAHHWTISFLAVSFPVSGPHINFWSPVSHLSTVLHTFTFQFQLSLSCSVIFIPFLWLRRDIFTIVIVIICDDYMSPVVVVYAGSSRKHRTDLLHPAHSLSWRPASPVTSAATLDTQQANVMPLLLMSTVVPTTLHITTTVQLTRVLEVQNLPTYTSDASTVAILFTDPQNWPAQYA